MSNTINHRTKPSQVNPLQNFQLLLHVPDLPTLDTETAVSWQLFDRQSGLLREGSGTLSSAGDVPRAGRTVIVIPAQRIVCIETPLPPVSAQKRDALLRYAIEDKLTIDPATVHAVVLGKSASTTANTHVVAAIDRAWFSGVLQVLRGAGIEPAQAVSSAALIAVSVGEWAVVIEGEHGLARRADGFAYSFDVAAPNANVPVDPPFALALALKEARDGQGAPTQLTVFVDQRTNQASNAAWVDTWQRVLDCRVRVAARPPPRMVTVDAGNLLAGDFAPRQSGNGWIALLKPAMTITVLIAVLHLAFTVVDAWRLDQRRRALEGDMVQVFKESFPNAQAIVDPPLQMKRNLIAMKRERGLGADDDARLLLAQLTAIIKSVPNVTPQRITIAEGTASIEATVPAPAAQALLKAATAETAGATFAVDAQNIVRLTIKAQR